MSASGAEADAALAAARAAVAATPLAFLDGELRRFEQTARTPAPSA
jgi:hypothetical protein